MNDKSLVGYCGLYCGDCHNYTGSIADLAQELMKELKKNNFAEVAKVMPFKEFNSYPECYECLGAMVQLRCEGCREGSRSKFCNIAQCAVKNDYEGCWECDRFQTCNEFDFLKPIHKDANLKNLKKIKKLGIKGFLKGKRDW